MPNRAIAPELLRYAAWATVETDLLPDGETVRFKRLECAVKAACDGIKSGEIERQYGVDRKLLYYHLKRCTAPHADGRVRGFRALVKGACRKPYVRTAPLVPGADGAGLAGAFGCLLRQYPPVATWLRGRLAPAHAHQSHQAQATGLPMMDIEEELLIQLRKAGCTADQYPFNSERLGYNSLCTYAKNLIQQGNDAVARAQFGDQATEAMGRNAAHGALLRPIVSLERAAYDEYQLPDISTIAIQIDGEEVDVPLKRGYFCPLVDFRSGAVLGYSFSIANRFRALDLLTAFESAVHPLPRVAHQAFKDLPPLPSEGLPAAVVTEATGRRICNLCVDNHLTHLAGSVVTELRQRTGVAITFGKVHSWIERHVVEVCLQSFNALCRV